MLRSWFCSYYATFKSLFSSFRVFFHIATTSLHTICTHVGISVNSNTLQWLVSLNSDVFVAMLRRERLACGCDWGAKLRENKLSNTLYTFNHQKCYYTCQKELLQSFGNICCIFLKIHRIVTLCCSQLTFASFQYDHRLTHLESANQLVW